MEWIIAHYQDILAIIGAAVTLASLAVKLTPSQEDDALVGKVVSFLEYFSIFNKNAPK